MKVPASEGQSTEASSPTGIKIPAQMRAIVLDGIGFSHLALKTVPTPRPGPGQMLARVDAAGICTSLLKLIDTGSNHTLLSGWDIAAHPIILGDEGCVTLVEIGSELQSRYKTGERYVIQPSLDVTPINHREQYRDDARGVNKVAVGYTIGGHLAEYVLVTEEVLEAKCLLPLPDHSLPYAHAAIAEPFSCVISGQDHHVHLSQDDPLGQRHAKRGLKAGGVAVIQGAGAMGRMHVALAMSYRPRAIIVADLVQSRLELVQRLFAPRAAELGIKLTTLDPGKVNLRETVQQQSNFLGADDVIVAVGARPVVIEAQGLLGRGAVLNLFGGLKKGDDSVAFETGLIHYNEVNVTGSSGGSPWDVARTLELMAAGEINAGDHIARIGDLSHAADFLNMIKAQAIDGKAVVYPHRRTSEILTVKSWTAQDERAYLQQN